ncbi:MAG: hypothetical protein R2932_12915 [Caldilineaceae bacterium]
MIGISTNLGYSAVRRVDAGSASMLNKLTLFSALWGAQLRERFRSGQIGATLAMAGSLQSPFSLVTICALVHC